MDGWMDEWMNDLPNLNIRVLSSMTNTCIMRECGTDRKAWSQQTNILWIALCTDPCFLRIKAVDQDWITVVTYIHAYTYMGFSACECP